MSCISHLKTRNLADFYCVTHHLTSGSYSKVYKCIRKSDNKPFALKQIPKKNLSKQEFKSITQEIKILKSLNHPNIVKLFDIFESNNHFYLVLELCNSGDLLDYVNRITTETQVAYIVYVLVKSINYCHKMGIVHRDLKLQNILLTSEGVLKLTDFGLGHYSGKMKSGCNTMYTQVGTPYYVSPEVLLGGGYNYMTDYWSLGVIVYKLIAGVYPFNGLNVQKLYENIIENNCSFKEPIWKNVSELCKDFIKGLLHKNPNKRYNAKQILNHEWIVKTLHLKVNSQKSKKN